MRKSLITIMFLALLMHIGSNNAFSESCGTCPTPPISTPGGDHPDETFAVDRGSDVGVRSTLLTKNKR